jgi:hypothetical protein
MSIPAAERAEIDPVKIRDYLLSTSHPVGRFKAAFFARLGYTSDNWQRLEADLRDLVMTREGEPGQESRYGRKYEVRGMLKGPSGRSAAVVSVWIIPSGGEIPHFVTAFPGRAA